MSLNPSAQFVRELRSLLRSPYTLIHVRTHEEDRALQLLHQLASADGRGLHEWSAVTGFDGSDSQGRLRQAFDHVTSRGDDDIYVFKDVAHLLEHDIVLQRALREMINIGGTFGKTIIVVGPSSIEATELDKELTLLDMPLPDRATIGQECMMAFPEHAYPHLDHDRLISGAMGLTVREAHRAFHRVRLQYGEALERNSPFDLEEAILREKQRIIGRSDTLEFHPLNEGLGDVGGLDALKRWLAERSRAFTPEARAYGLPAPKGLLLIGVQGCGKSLTAKAVGRYWGLPLLRLDLGRIFDGKRAPEEALRQALSTSEAISPCVLWMDEIEKGFGADGAGTTHRVLGSLLTWLQEKSAPVFLVATANQIDALPPELLRKGRFDEIFFVDLPQVHEREDILTIHLQRRGRQLESSVVSELAKRCEYFSGSELEQVVISALYVAFAEDRELEPDDLVFAARQTVPLYRTYEEQIKGLREWAQDRARPASLQRRLLDFFET